MVYGWSSRRGQELFLQDPGFVITPGEYDLTLICPKEILVELRALVGNVKNEGVLRLDPAGGLTGRKRNAQLDVLPCRFLDMGHAFVKGEWVFFGALTTTFYLPGLKKASTCLFQLVQITRWTQHGPRKCRFRYTGKLVNHIFN
jgi:hypothetical protein